MKFRARVNLSAILLAIATASFLLENSIDNNGLRAYCISIPGLLIIFTPYLWAPWSVPAPQRLLKILTLLVTLIVVLVPPWQAVGVWAGTRLIVDAPAYHLGYGFIFSPPAVPSTVRNTIRGLSQFAFIAAEPLSGWVYAELSAVAALYWLGRLVLHLRKELEESRRKKPGRCFTCGYDLRASSDRCPECGMIPHAPKR